VTRPLARPARLALLLLGIAFGLGAERIRLVAGWSVAWVVADLIPGIAFLVAGTVAWQRRPDNRIGPLMVATGFAWYVGTYSASFNPLIDSLGYGFQGYYDALLAWLVLAYPSGRLRWRSSRLVIAAFLALLATRSLFRLALFRPSTALDLSDPGAVDRYIADVSLRDAGDALFRVGIVGLSIAILVLVVVRFRRETVVGRQVAGPILLGGVALAIGVLLEFAAMVTADTFAERSAASDLGQALTVVSAALVPVGFAVGLIRSRLSRGSVADLVVELGQPASPPVLRDLLARTLRDPTLEIAYTVAGTKAFVGFDGRPIELPPPDDGDRAMTRLERGGETMAVLIHDPAIAEQPELVRSVTAAAGLALDNERLAAEVRSQLEEVRSSRARIVAAGDAERRRVERDLHDGAQQRLVTLALALQVARTHLDGSDSTLASMLDRANDELGLALGELRELARGLHPTVLTEEGIAAAVEALADRSPVPVATTAPPGRYSPVVEATAYFVVAEALTNVAKYARARSATVTIVERDGQLVVEVADDGAGGADPAKGSGLRGLTDRVAAAGGRLTVSSEVGHGTSVRAEIPCA
jgi:signal transduction histidine kinase